jgi:hypothetical protein
MSCQANQFSFEPQRWLGAHLKVIIFHTRLWLLTLIEARNNVWNVPYYINHFPVFQVYCIRNNPANNSRVNNENCWPDYMRMKENAGLQWTDGTYQVKKFSCSFIISMLGWRIESTGKPSWIHLLWACTTWVLYFRGQILMLYTPSNQYATDLSGYGSYRFVFFSAGFSFLPIVSFKFYYLKAAFSWVLAVKKTTNKSERFSFCCHYNFVDTISFNEKWRVIVEQQIRLHIETLDAAGVTLIKHDVALSLKRSTDSKWEKWLERWLKKLLLRVILAKIKT